MGVGSTRGRWPAARLVALVSLAGAALPSAVRAEGTDASVTSTTIGELHTNNDNAQKDDDDYVALFERLNVAVHNGDLSTDARLDGALFLNAPDEGYQHNLQLERLNVTWRPGGWSLTAGDYFQQLGRGIVLSLRKVNEAGVDVALRGARLGYQGDVHGFTAFAGQTNPANIDSVSQRFMEDPRDLLAGGVYELAPLPALRVGFFGLYNQPEERVLDDLDWSLSGGVLVDAPSLVDWLTLYGEAAVQHRALAGVSSQGSALYGNAEARFGDFGLISEVLLLHNFEQKGSRNTALGNRFDYNQPPTLERIDQEVANNRDVAGGRVRAEYYFFDLDLLLYANAMYRLNDPGKSSELHQVHAFGGFEWVLPGGSSRVAAAIGARDESQQLFPERRALRSMLHVDADWLQTVGGGFALHATSNSQLWTFLGKQFVRGSTLVGVERAGLGGVTFELGYDTQNQAPDIRNLFHALIVAWELTESASFRGTVGTQRGGIKCVAGVCREFPAFAGARGELVTRF